MPLTRCNEHTWAASLSGCVSQTAFHLQVIVLNIWNQSRRRDENKQNPHDGCARGIVWTLRMTHNNHSAVVDLSVGSLIFTATLDHLEV